MVASSLKVTTTTGKRVFLWQFAESLLKHGNSLSWLFSEQISAAALAQGTLGCSKPARADNVVVIGKANLPYCSEITGMVGGTEGRMVEVSEGPVWINLKDGPMVLSRRMSRIEIPSVMTGWGHNSPNTFQLGQHVLSASMHSKGIVCEVAARYSWLFISS